MASKQREAGWLGRVARATGWAEHRTAEQVESREVRLTGVLHWYPGKLAMVRS